ncbi:MAG: ribonuclease domain-containing protein, partial [Ruthenibacterium sp.]
YRGAERLLYSSDGLIYTTDDHYKTFRKINLTALQTADAATK